MASPRSGIGGQRRHARADEIADADKLNRCLPASNQKQGEPTRKAREGLGAFDGVQPSTFCWHYSAVSIAKKDAVRGTMRSPVCKQLFALRHVND